MRKSTAAKLIGVVAVLAMASSAGAQVYRCKDASGKPVYSDSPCGGVMIDRARSQDEIAEERMQAAEARQRFREDQAYTRERDAAEARKQAQTAAAHAYGGGGDGNSVECERANRDVEVTAGSITGDRRDREMRVQEARRRANIACYGPARAADIDQAAAGAPKIQRQRPNVIINQPDTRPRFCRNEGNGRMFCF